MAHAKPVLAVLDGRVTTLSTHVASVFGRQHKHVLDAIEVLRADCPEVFSQPNFRPCTYRAGHGRDETAYQLTRDGFTLLAMGFTGKKALQFKLAYIDAFNRMEATLRAGADAGPYRALPPLLAPLPAVARAHFDLPGVLHRQLKVLAAVRKTSMRNVVIDLITEAAHRDGLSLMQPRLGTVEDSAHV